MNKNLKRVLALLLLCGMLISAMVLASCSHNGEDETDVSETVADSEETEKEEEETTRKPMPVVPKPPKNDDDSTNEPTPPADTDPPVEQNPGVGEIVDWEDDT